MTRPVRKIGILLILLFTLPIIIFLSYELNSLSSDEEIISKIYNNQLESILFSVNQYSDDLLGSWANKVEQIYSEYPDCSSEDFGSGIGEFLDATPSVANFFLVPYGSPDSIRVFGRNDTHPDIDQIRSVIDTSRDKIRRLMTYKRGGYRKLEPAESGIFGEKGILLFIMGEEPPLYKICGFIIDPEIFIQVALRPKMQSITLNEVVIGVKKTANDSLVFSTEEIASEDLGQTRQVWILPDYLLGIALKGESVETIARDRIFINMLLIVIVSFVILIGGVLIFRTIKNEVELAQIKSDFISNVSHELRTPLALISMYAETLELDRVKSDTKRKEYYKIISHETGRLSKIVNGILNFSRMEAGKRVFNLEITDLNSVVEDVLNTYDFHLKNKGFKLRYEPSADTLGADLDSEAVSEALINILDNAVKYSGDSDELRLRTGRDGEFVYVEVTDFGVGISLEDQKKIFDKFYRVQSGLVHNTKGTGLGLALVSQIMKAHKGKIDLESAPGKGSTFTLKFPAHRSTNNGMKE